MEDKTVIEINGIKLEVDLRTARRIDELRVGDRVKILQKKYGDEYAGTIVGFEPFQARPTIIIAYLEISYNTAEIKFVHFNAATKDIEVVKAIDNDHLDMDRGNILQMFDRQVAAKQKEIDDLNLRREYFVKQFRAYWENIEAAV